VWPTDEIRTSGRDVGRPKTEVATAVTGPDGVALARRQGYAVGSSAFTRAFGAAILGTAAAVFIGRRGSPFAVGLVATSFSVGTMLFAPAWGALADVTGRRRLAAVLASGLAACALLFLPLVTDIWASLALLALYAVFASGYGTIVLSILSVDSGTGDRGRAIGFFNGANAAGVAGGQVAVGLLLTVLTRSELYVLVSITLFVGTALIAFVRDNGPELEPLSLSEILGKMRGRLLPRAGSRDHLTTNGLSWLYFAMVLRVTAIAGVGSIMPVFLVQELGLSEIAMGLLLALNPALQTYLMYRLGRSADRIGRKPLIVGGMIGSGGFALVVSTASLVPSIAFLRQATVALGYVVLALSFSAMWTASIAFVGDVASAERNSELIGYLTTASSLGGVIGPAAVGAMATVFSYTTAFAVASLAAFAAAVTAAARVRETQTDATPSLVDVVVRVTPFDPRRLAKSGLSGRDRED
jgi:MFS family permease